MVHESDRNDGMQVGLFHPTNLPHLHRDLSIHVSYEKNPPTFHYTGGFTGILCIGL